MRFVVDGRLKCLTRVTLFIQNGATAELHKVSQQTDTCQINILRQTVRTLFAYFNYIELAIDTPWRTVSRMIQPCFQF